ncbi:MAG: hypothetical protein FWD77_03840 [Betaproteobacteria bacterium]|nr:hypothetical protein [Betaproteobacteria bacterium]
MAGGRKPGVPKTGGRKAGTPNKATASLRSIAGRHTEEAICALLEIMKDSSAPHSARVAAANGILDRAHGKPSENQHVTLEGSVNPWKPVSELTDEELEAKLKKYGIES